MKVKELIKKLEKCDQDAVVCVYNGLYENDMYVESVKEMVYHSEDKHKPYGIYDESKGECLYCKRWTAIEEEDMEKLVVLYDRYYEDDDYDEDEDDNEEEVFDCPFKVGDVVVPSENADLDELDLPENTKKLTIVEINKNGTVDVDIDTGDNDFCEVKCRLIFVMNPKDLKLA